jgi:hypothetical protein
MMLTVLGGLIGTFLAWCVFQFIGRPLVKFRELDGFVFAGAAIIIAGIFWNLRAEAART